MKETASRSLQRFLWQPGVWIGGFYPDRDTRVHYNWIEEPIEITPDDVTIRIRDDATWSDGHTITGKDIACVSLQQSLRKYYPPFYATEGKDEPADTSGAFDDFEITEKTVTYRSSASHFKKFWDIHIIGRLGAGFGSRVIPTHIDPFATYADAVIETARRAQAGEIDPWSGNDGQNRDALVHKHLAKKKYVEKFSKPEHVLSSGPWDLVKLSENEFIFEQNSHHQYADAINFDRFIFEYMPSGQGQRAALKADRLDYAGASSGSPTPQPVVESLPDTIKYLRVPGSIGTGTELELNHNHPALGVRGVRKAIMYALNHAAIAKNIHQSVAVPFTTPGGDCWDATNFVTQKWINDNLTTYTQDREQAASLMRMAGYTRDGGQWVGDDGEPLTLTLATTSDTPRWEPTVASQLSEFGIKTTVMTTNGNTFRDRINTGEVFLWNSINNTGTNNAPYTLLIWEGAAKSPEKLGFYSDEQYETGKFSSSGTPLPRTEKRWSDFTIQAPAIGEPDGPLQKYHPSALALWLSTNPPKAEFRRRVKIGMWLANWFLPTIPLTKQYSQHFIDDTNWLWPTDSPSWKSFTSGDTRPAGDVLGSGAIRANSDNPDQN